MNPYAEMLRAQGVPMKSDHTPSRVGATAVAQPRSGPIDPSRTNVFVEGPDGKLQPIPGWKTTGPFDVKTWGKNIDWVGAARDMATIVAGAVAGGGAPGLASRLGSVGARGGGLTRSDALTLGAGVYSSGDQTTRELSPPNRPKNW